MCELTTLTSTLLAGVSQGAAHLGENAAIEGQNRTKLRNFEAANRQYDREVMLDRAQYRNDIINGDIDFDTIHRAMVDQWTEEDLQLKELFAENDHEMEKALIEMYENEYAGTQTGRTAARLASKSAVKMGQKRSRGLHNLMMAEEKAITAKDITRSKKEADARSTYEKIRFAPIHGVTPMAPEMEPKKSSAGLILGLATSAVGGYADYKSGMKTDKLLEGIKS